MALRDGTRVIGDHSYYCIQLPARKSMKLKARLAKVLGHAFSGILMAKGKSKEEQASAFVKALGDLFETNSEDEIVDLMVEVVCMANVDKTLMDGNKFDEIFSENIMDAYKVFLFVLEINYGNLFKGQLEDISNQLANAKT